MNTPPKPPTTLSVQYVGPIFQLDGTLTNCKQNLIFARNGTGKSFISRAFRYLDVFTQGENIDNAPTDLVSDEASALGMFRVSRGDTVIGSLNLNRDTNHVDATLSNTIFHVFSEDFINQELREKEFDFDGEIETKIVVDQENIETQKAEEELAQFQKNRHSLEKSLQEELEHRKLSELCTKAGVSRNLKEYKDIKVNNILDNFPEKPTPASQGFAEKLEALEKIRSIPSEPIFPQKISTLDARDIDFSEIKDLLTKVTSPSTVSDAIKEKIHENYGFFQHGLRLLEERSHDQCPFCEQSITGAIANEVIDQYIKYFQDKEQKHKSEIDRLNQIILGKRRQLDECEKGILKSARVFDDLKSFLPSKRDEVLPNPENEIASVRNKFDRIQQCLDEKYVNLDKPVEITVAHISPTFVNLDQKVAEVNSRIDGLVRAFDQADRERKSLQRELCAKFELEFALDKWQAISEISDLRRKESLKGEEIAKLRESATLASARDRVAETFSYLLKGFFGTKYVFEKQDFTLKRGDVHMTRGAHRTLSDGEKTTIAFCYFIACIHKKVKQDKDYRNIFLVFDDPVNSMSFDFVFSIAQAIKFLCVSDDGAISLKPGEAGESGSHRPETLILTHSSYFFNILLTNGVVPEKACFSLHEAGQQHKIVTIRKYIAPFQQQLKDVYQVALGGEPDHTTANAVRSVLEAVGRFCRPEKCKSLSDFVTHVAKEDGIEVKSILINSLCHGTYYEEVPQPEDLKRACNEVLEIVQRYAGGQIEVVKELVDTG